MSHDGVTNNVTIEYEYNIIKTNSVLMMMIKHITYKPSLRDCKVWGGGGTNEYYTCMIY